MSRQTANGMHGSRDTYLLSPKTNMPGPVHQGATRGSPCLETGNDKMALPAPDIVLEMMPDPATGTHPAAGDDDRTLRI